MYNYSSTSAKMETKIKYETAFKMAFYFMKFIYWVKNAQVVLLHLLRTKNPAQPAAAHIFTNFSACILYRPVFKVYATSR